MHPAIRALHRPLHPLRLTAALGLAVLASAPTLAAQGAAPTAGQAAPPAGPNAEEMRELIARWNDEWGKARVALDTVTLERMLPPDYYAVFGDSRMTRDEFMTGVLSPPEGVVIRRFDPAVLTVRRNGEEWIAVVEEKLEMDRRQPDGTTQRTYHLWIIRDYWKQTDGRWVLGWGEVISNESWRGTTPPFDDWNE